MGTQPACQHLTSDICCGHTTEIMVKIKDQQYLTQNCQNLFHKFYPSHFETLGKEFSPKSWQFFNHYISPFVGYWHTVEIQEIRLVKTIEHLSKAADYLFS